MSKKYILQNNIQNFAYPNNTLAEYDVDIIHELKENNVNGVVSNFNFAFAGSNIDISFDYTWNLNGAEPYINNIGNLNVLSVHMMTPEKPYFKPWINVGYVSDNNPNLTTKSGTFSTTITPAMMGESSFGAGNYYFEIRMISHRDIYVITANLNETPIPPPTGCSNPSVCVQLNVTGVTSFEGPYATIQYIDCNGNLINKTYQANGNYYICVGYVDSTLQINSYTLMDTPVIYVGHSCDGTGTPCPTGYTPFSIYYDPSSKILTVGSSIGTWSPTVSDTLTGATISPTLPSGLTFNTTTGVITGTPLVTSTNTTYTVSGFTATQSGTTTIQIEVDASSEFTQVTPQVDLAYKVGGTTCDNIGALPTIYLDSTDYAIYVANGGCFSDGGTNTVSVIRNSDGTPVSGTFYFVWNIGVCTITTFKSTIGNLTTRPTQC